MYISYKVRKMKNFILDIPMTFRNVFENIIKAFLLQPREGNLSALSTTKLILTRKMQKIERNFLKLDGVGNI
tara:strand:- start:96 stop:311 length:216 start_codon:yes stop_codon:yes gene_type:complete